MHVGLMLFRCTWVHLPQAMMCCTSLTLDGGTASRVTYVRGAVAVRCWVGWVRPGCRATRDATERRDSTASTAALSAVRVEGVARERPGGNTPRAALCSACTSLCSNGGPTLSFIHRRACFVQCGMFFLGSCSCELACKPLNSKTPCQEYRNQHTGIQEEEQASPRGRHRITGHRSLLQAARAARATSALGAGGGGAEHPAVGACLPGCVWRKRSGGAGQAAWRYITRNRMQWARPFAGKACIAATGFDTPLTSSQGRPLHMAGRQSAGLPCRFKAD